MVGRCAIFFEVQASISAAYLPVQYPLWKLTLLKKDLQLQPGRTWGDGDWKVVVVFPICIVISNKTKTTETAKENP
jgi:hypothetical protein